MALTYQQLAAAANDTTFQSRLKIALANAAVAIAVDSPAAGLETRRDAFARHILRDLDNWTVRFAPAVAAGFGAKSNATLTDATDQEIMDRVSAVFNDLMVSL